MMKVSGVGRWLASLVVLAVSGAAHGQQSEATGTSYLPVVVKESPETIRKRMEAAKPGIMRRQLDLLADRYDLGDRPAAGVTMSRGKPVQGGVRVKLPAGMTWDALGAMTPEEIRDKDLFPQGFLPLPHPNHPRGAWSSPSSTSTRSSDRTAATSTRFDLDFDLPDHFLPEFPPPIFLTTRPDLGDVSQGKLVTHRELLRALQRHPQPQAARGPAAAGHAVPAAAVQRRPTTAAAERPSRGVACFDCHVNGHTNGGDAPGRRHPPAGAPPPDRHADACAA